MNVEMTEATARQTIEWAEKEICWRNRWGCGQYTFSYLYKVRQEAIDFLGGEEKA